MSASLQWLLIRDNSSFLVKSKANNLTFSRESGNLRNVNSFASNGLIHKKTVNVSASKKRGVIITTKNVKKTKSGKKFNTVKLATHPRAINASIKGITKNYRKDLMCAALSRATAIIRTRRNKAVYKNLKAKIGKKQIRRGQRKYLHKKKISN